MRPRRVTLIVAAALLLGACGKAPAPRTLDGEIDLAGAGVPQGLRSSLASDLTRLTRACRAPEFRNAVDEQLNQATTEFTITDVQCQWTFGAPSLTQRGPRQLVVGLIEDGDYRLHETAKLLTNERVIDGVGGDALYDVQSRTLFCARNGRLWYVQMIGNWGPQYDARALTTNLARVLMRERATE